MRSHNFFSGGEVYGFNNFRGKVSKMINQMDTFLLNLHVLEAIYDCLIIYAIKHIFLNLRDQTTGHSFVYILSSNQIFTKFMDENTFSPVTIATGKTNANVELLVSFTVIYNQNMYYLQLRLNQKSFFYLIKKPYIYQVNSY